MPDYAKSKNAAKSIFELFDRTPRMNNWESENGEIVKPEEFEGNIEVKQIEFTYPSRPEAKILKGMDLEIKKGQVVALVGSSGCGIFFYQIETLI